MFAAQIPHRPVLYTWFLRKTVLGDPVEITGSSTTKPFQIGIPDFGSQLHGSTVFSKLDLQKGYYQVPMSPEDAKKTAIITPFGLWEFVKMPFGLRNAGQTFQRMMDMILAGLPYAIIYVDDILVFSPDLQTHVEHLRSVLDICRLHGPSVSPSASLESPSSSSLATESPPIGSNL